MSKPSHQDLTQSLSRLFDAAAKCISEKMEHPDVNTGYVVSEIEKNTAAFNALGDQKGPTVEMMARNILASDSRNPLAKINAQIDRIEEGSPAETIEAALTTVRMVAEHISSRPAPKAFN